MNMMLSAADTGVEPSGGCGPAPIRGGFEAEPAEYAIADDWGVGGGGDAHVLSDFYSGGRKATARRSVEPASASQIRDDGESHGSALAAASDKGHRADALAAITRLSTDMGECSEVVGRRPGEPCSSARVAAAVKKFVAAGAIVPSELDKNGTAASAAPPTLPTAASGEAAAFRAAAQVLGCTSESCVVSHPTFRRFVGDDGAGLAEVGGVNVLDVEIARRFKTKGPRDSTQLLSNFNIDGVLQEWAAAHKDFYNFSFNMMDFERSGGSLARTDAASILEGRAPQNLGNMGGTVRRPCTTFACVLNTDVSTGRGKHWVAVFGDCRGGGDWTVEYFNSAGNPPPAPVTRWLEETASRLSTHRSSHPRRYGSGAVDPVTLSDVRHQNSQTECGLYALFYIRRRLEGAPLSEFRETRIPDVSMTAFRKHVFRSGD
jgi:hypothetical protein